MAEVLNITKESVEDAIELIDKNPEKRNGRKSTDYDLIHEGKAYPPILVLSEANKILGGDELTIEDFSNSAPKAIGILKKMGFDIEKKNIVGNLQSRSSKFDPLQFYQDAVKANLKISKELSLRFIASLLSKNFVILTGLSGSGKTKIALAFTKWISEPGKVFLKSGVFQRGEIIKSNRVEYKVIDLDSLSVTFIQDETGTKVNLPYELIYEWIDVIKEHNFSTSTGPREIRNKVDEVTKYSKQLNSFETHLKAAAFHLIEKPSVPIDESTQVCLVPVGADWTNREPLFGYPDALNRGNYISPDNGVLDLLIEASKAENAAKPYFLILDEMNLSHVERYFADFLSAMESGEEIPLHAGKLAPSSNIPKGIRIPENFFIIGTVNIDETTYMFSPKVLDRANVIEFKVSEREMREFLMSGTKINLDVLKGAGSSMGPSFIEIVKDKSIEPTNKMDLIQPLLIFFNELKKIGAEFGYRSSAEILRFAAVVNRIEPNWNSSQIIDSAIMQKLLPKIHGSRRKLEPTLKLLGELCLYEGQKIDDFIPPNTVDFNDLVKIKYPLSLEKILRMYKGLIDNGFTSYPEA